MCNYLVTKKMEAVIILIPNLNWVHSAKVLYPPVPHFCSIKALANEDTLLRTHCCRHKCFPVCPRAQHLLRTQILCPGHIKCFWFCSETFCVRNKCFPVCAAQGTSWASMCPQQCVHVYQSLNMKNNFLLMLVISRAWILNSWGLNKGNHDHDGVCISDLN